MQVTESRAALDQTVNAWMKGAFMLVVRLWVAYMLVQYVGYTTVRLQAIIVTLLVAGTLAFVMRPIAHWMAGLRAFDAFHSALAWPFAQVGAMASRRLRPGAPTAQRRGLGLYPLRIIATLYTLIMLITVTVYGVRVTTDPFVTELKRVQENWTQYSSRMRDYSRDATAWYERNVKPEWRTWIEQQIDGDEGVGALRDRATTWFGLGVLRGAENVRHIVEVVLMPVLAFYFVIDSRKLKHIFVGSLGRRRRREALYLLRQCSCIMHSFIVSQLVLCLIAGIVVGIGLAALGVPYPLTLGLLGGITRAIPVIGSIIGGIPIVLLALVSQGPIVAAWVLIFFSILHFTESKFIMPLLIGDSLDLHPVVIIVVLLVGGEFGGLLGMFFAAPVAALVRVMLMRYWICSGAADGAGPGRAGLTPSQVE